MTKTVGACVLNIIKNDNKWKSNKYLFSLKFMHDSCLSLYSFCIKSLPSSHNYAKIFCASYQIRELRHCVQAITGVNSIAVYKWPNTCRRIKRSIILSTRFFINGKCNFGKYTMATIFVYISSGLINLNSMNNARYSISIIV